MKLFDVFKTVNMEENRMIIHVNHDDYANDFDSSIHSSTWIHVMANREVINIASRWDAINCEPYIYIMISEERI